eukprot:CAMPEP_0180645410 /NCGR_PEP_ID=MMETSP1037_2-20121125/48973_1 /TAXON_ID=632150 /ORGANISM="Azadinium spinosum, Strain 3D9" /LENGTH=32 /DNA_ID= /DNA_START= /DNA_END= /DNA_ORIENTATION=
MPEPKGATTYVYVAEQKFDTPSTMALPIAQKT